MPNKLFVKPIMLPNSAAVDVDSVPFDWALCSGAGEMLASGEAQSKSELDHVISANDIQDIRVVGVIGASLLSFHGISVPGRPSVVQQAMPYAVEEFLAQDIEDVHLALGDKDDAGKYKVGVISDGLMAAAMDFFGQLGFPLQAVYANADLLPDVTGDDVNLVVSGQTALVKGPGTNLVELKVTNLPLYLDSLTDEDTEDSARLTVYISEGDQVKHSIILAELSQSEHFDIDIKPSDVPLIEFVAASWFHSTQKTDLAQGRYKIVSESHGGLGRWKAVASVAAIWFVAHVALNIGQGFYYNHKAQTIRDSALVTYKSYFPDERRVNSGNLSRMLRGKLVQAQQSTADAGFLNLLAETGQQYSRLPERSSMIFSSMNYSSQRGELLIEIQARNFNQMDMLKNNLVSGGLQARISSAVNEKDAVKGRLTISGS